MQRVRTNKKIRPESGSLRALLLAGAAVGLVLTSQAGAQQAGGLRGGLSSDSADSTLLSDNGLPSPTYVPASPGAVPDETSAPSPNGFEEEPAATGSATSTTSARRQATAETDDTTTGTTPVPTVDSEENLPLDPGAERAQPIEGLNRPQEDNPFEAVGVRWGTFILRPTLETGITATSNADSSVNGSSAVLSETTLRLNAASDWSSHRASVNAFGTFTNTLSGQEVDRFAGGVDAELELELGTEYRAIGTFTYSAEPESAASPVVVPDTVEEPINQTVGGTLGLERDVGKATFGLTGGILNNTYGDADLEGGGVLSQKDRDSTLYTLSLRGGYEMSPTLTPFVETEIGRNQYDQKVDSAGYERSADLYAFRAGLEFDMSEKLSGEVAAGWVSEDFDDARLDTLSTPTFEANVLWSPLRGTNVRLSGSTELEGTTTPGESGSVLYSTSMAIERQMRVNLTGDATLGYGYRNYAESDGYDVIWNASASLTWWLNRYAGLVGRVSYEDVSSNLPDRDSDTSSIFLGLKLQR
ncbi:MAG: outer membrane beta-barrel protein [Mesorhizobium sp.]|nr:outer membrane beta-barrel protein [Mesorhizobium sp.]MBL8578273.1 outer membrane beta-barrel protein [Mesorhizobium sp.]